MSTPTCFDRFIAFVTTPDASKLRSSESVTLRATKGGEVGKEYFFSTQAITQNGFMGILTCGSWAEIVVNGPSMALYGTSREDDEVVRPQDEVSSGDDSSGISDPLRFLAGGLG